MSASLTPGIRQGDETFTAQAENDPVESCDQGCAQYDATVQHW